MKASELISNTAKTAKSLAKALLLSRRVSLKSAHPDKPLIIMANGPSLRQTIDSSSDILKKYPAMSVNFAPNTPDFFDLKPQYHIMADPLFFAANQPENIRTLYENLARVGWELTLLIPNKHKKNLPSEVTGNRNITIATFNFVGLDGFGPVRKLLYNSRLGMPRPRNVLIPALMCGIWLGFKKIYITGADHSWMQTISVDEANCVISVQPHFYKEDKGEQKRVDATYRNYRLHEIVESFAIAFRSYHDLRRYTDSRGISIFNATPGSFIDAFERKSLPSD